MSFFAEVINIVKENEISDARSCLKKLTKEILNHQTESKALIDAKYTQFSDAVWENKQQLDQADHLAHEVERLLESIERDSKEEILASADDVHQYLTELDELQVGLRISKKLLKIHQLFEELKVLRESKYFHGSRNIINNLRELIFEQEDKDILLALDCFKNMKFRYHIEHQTLLDNLQKQFNAHVQLQEKTFPNSKCVDVKISTDEAALQMNMCMLFETNFNANRLYTFLLKNVFEPIITRPLSFEMNKTGISSKEDNPNETFHMFTMSFSTKPLGEFTSLRPNYRNVLGNLSKVFNTLLNLNAKLPNGKLFFQQMAEKIGDDVYKMLIDECLIFAVPDSIEDLKASKLAEEIRILNEQFMDVKFYTETTENKLLEFADKIEIIFKKRFCLKIVNNAVEIMHKDLHEMQIVEDGTKSNAFPRCMVSRNTFEIISLMETILEKSNETTSKSVDDYVLTDIQERLLSTIPMILEQYPSEVIQVHGKFLQTIPQQTALFHNNCAYLAWWFNKYNSSASNMVVHSERSTAIVSELQAQGSKQFALQMTNQRSQIMEIMKEFDLADSMVELGPQPMKIIRQCLRQLDLLKNVWQTILPESVYSKTMGTIINDLCDEIIRKVLSREDISSAVANGLVNIMETVAERVPLIFADPNEVAIYVKHWVKLQQVQMILGASMAQIADQWADGKGPLTLNFRAEDIRHLIRALFQNTDRRANVLSSIV